MEGYNSQDNYNTTPEEIKIPTVEPTITVSQPVVETPEASAETPPPEIPKPAGVLFDVIAYPNNSDVPEFIERMKIQDAIFVLISAASLGHKRGIYSLIESEVVSKAIRVISTPPPTPMDLKADKQFRPDTKVAG